MSVILVLSKIAKMKKNLFALSAILFHIVRPIVKKKIGVIIKKYANIL